MMSRLYFDFIREMQVALDFVASGCKFNSETHLHAFGSGMLLPGVRRIFTEYLQKGSTCFPPF